MVVEISVGTMVVGFLFSIFTPLRVLHEFFLLLGWFPWAVIQMEGFF
jgi:hypothetical protein